MVAFHSLLNVCEFLNLVIQFCSIFLGQGVCSGISAVGGFPSGQPCSVLSLHSAVGLISPQKACQSFLVVILLRALSPEH